MWIILDIIIPPKPTVRRCIWKHEHISIHSLGEMPPKKRARVATRSAKSGKQMKLRSGWAARKSSSLISLLVNITASTTQRKQTKVKQPHLVGRGRQRRRTRSHLILQRSVTGSWSLSPTAALRTASMWRYGAATASSAQSVHVV